MPDNIFDDQWRQLCSDSRQHFFTADPAKELDREQLKYALVLLLENAYRFDRSNFPQRILHTASPFEMAYLANLLRLVASRPDLAGVHASIAQSMNCTEASVQLRHTKTMTQHIMVDLVARIVQDLFEQMRADPDKLAQFQNMPETDTDNITTMRRTHAFLATCSTLMSASLEHAGKPGTADTPLGYLLGDTNAASRALETLHASHAGLYEDYRDHHFGLALATLTANPTPNDKACRRDKDFRTFDFMDLAICGNALANCAFYVDLLYLDRLGLFADAVAPARPLLRLLQGGYWFTRVGSALIVADRPRRVHLDEQYRLHNIEGPAMELGRHNIYAVAGAVLPPRML